MDLNRAIRTYQVLWVALSVILITVTIHLVLPFQRHPQIYYLLIAVWILFLWALLLALYKKDIERDTKLGLVRLSYLSSNMAQELRMIQASILESSTPDEIVEAEKLGFKTVLNLAHEYYSFIKGEYCTATVAKIEPSPDGGLRCRIVQYDDFVPTARREREVEIPFEQSLFGEIVKNDLRAITINDYTLDDYPIYVTPIIEEGYCVSGICVPIKVFDRVIGFFNIDSMKRNLFTSTTDERIASFFGEVLGQLSQTVQHRLRESGQETHPDGT